MFYGLFLKNKGFSFVTTINRTCASYLLAILGAEYVLRIVPEGTHTWNKFVAPNDLENILTKGIDYKCSLSFLVSRSIFTRLSVCSEFLDKSFVKFQMGLHFNPLTKHWSWSGDTSVNYALNAQKLH